MMYAMHVVRVMHDENVHDSSYVCVVIRGWQFLNVFPQNTLGASPILRE